MVVIVRARPDLLELEPSPANLPGSKSHSQRAMILAGLAPGSCILRGLLVSEDTAILAAALERLGARLDWQGDELKIRGSAGLARQRVRLELGENGTALRCLASVLPMLGLQVELDGQAGLRARPLLPVLAFLDDHGVPHAGDTLPLNIDGRGLDWRRPLAVDASLSSQVASGVLMGTALRLRHGLPSSRQVKVREPAAQGYLAVTGESLAACGYPTRSSETESGLLFTFGELGPQAQSLDIPVDPSSAAFPMVFAAMAGQVPRLPEQGGEHPDWGIVGDIQAMLAAGRKELSIDDLGSRPDCFPALCVLAACGTGQRQLRGAAALRAKESDRIAAMQAGLSALAVDCEELADGLIIRPGAGLPASAQPIPVPAAADHRVVMALALLGGRMPGGIRLEEDAAVAKSWPGFWDWLGENAVLEFR